MSDDFTTDRIRIYTLKLRELSDELPRSCAEFFRGIESTTSVLTRYGYALDLRLFFRFLIATPLCKGIDSIREINYSILENVDSDCIEQFLEYIALYPDETIDGEFITNGDRGKARKLSTVRSFFRYLYKKGRIKSNAPSLVDTPKIHQKPIVRLEPDEIYNLLESAESGTGLTETQKRFNKLTRLRDVAIITLFLGSGMRISELVGINIEDMNFMSNEVRITRKGGGQDILVFGEEVRAALLDFLLQRESMTAEPGHENALFLSLQRKRISVRSVELLVKKYSQSAVPLKQISPHKLRSTYGTMLYRETGDIYLVADVLGHRDVNTTRKHYAALSEDRRRHAAEVIKLRDSTANNTQLPMPNLEDIANKDE